jgi:hypothetical protein
LEENRLSSFKRKTNHLFCEPCRDAISRPSTTHDLYLAFGVSYQFGISKVRLRSTTELPGRALHGIYRIIFVFKGTYSSLFLSLLIRNVDVLDIISVMCCFWLEVRLAANELTNWLDDVLIRGEFLLLIGNEADAKNALKWSFLALSEVVFGTRTRSELRGNSTTSRFDTGK